MSHGICPRHPTAIAGQTCANCSHAMCAECTVPLSEQLLMCLPCALSKAGIRAGHTKKASWRSRRRDAKLTRQLAEDAKLAHEEAARLHAGEAVDPELLGQGPESGPSKHDWASPSWHS